MQTSVVVDGVTIDHWLSCEGAHYTSRIDTTWLIPFDYTISSIHFRGNKQYWMKSSSKAEMDDILLNLFLHTKKLANGNFALDLDHKGLNDDDLSYIFQHFIHCWNMIGFGPSSIDTGKIYNIREFQTHIDEFDTPPTAADWEIVVDDSFSNSSDHNTGTSRTNGLGEHVYFNENNDVSTWWENLETNKQHIPYQDNSFYRSLYLGSEQYWGLEELLTPTTMSLYTTDASGHRNQPIIFMPYLSNDAKHLDIDWDFSKPLVLPLAMVSTFIDSIHEDTTQGYLRDIHAIEALPTVIIGLDRVSDDDTPLDISNPEKYIEMRATIYQLAYDTIHIFSHEGKDLGLKWKYSKHTFVLNSPFDTNYDLHDDLQYIERL